MVEIFVGTESKEPYKIHLRLLSNRVPYFQNMFSGEFKEARERKAYLPDDTPASFNLFLEWLYGGAELRPVMSITDEAPVRALIELYCFAEKICQGDLMDCAMSALMITLVTHKRLPKTSSMLQAYNHTTPQSCLRKFIATSFVYLLYHGENKSKDWNIEELSDAMAESQDLRVDVLTLTRFTLTNKAIPDNPKYLPKCEFHIHEEDATCPYK